jgi:hypothetical protein
VVTRFFGELKTRSIKGYLFDIDPIKSTESEITIKFQDEHKEYKSEIITNNKTGEKNEPKVIQLKRGLKVLQDHDYLKKRMEEGIFCFFTREANATKLIEEPSDFKLKW